MNIELNPRVSAKNPANIGATAPMILCGRKSNANPRPLWLLGERSAIIVFLEAILKVLQNPYPMKASTKRVTFGTMRDRGRKR